MSDFKPASQHRLYQTVSSQLREVILNGRYSPGDRLPTERELMDDFGVSRAVIRQATMNLEQEGLLEVRVGSGGGAFITESGVDAMCRAFVNTFRHRGAEIHEYLAVKRALTPALVEGVIENYRPELHETLTDNMTRLHAGMEGGASDQEMLAISLEFHDLLAHASKNLVLETLVVALTRCAWYVPAFTSGTRSDWPQILTEHQQLLEALRRGDHEQFSRLAVAHLGTVDRIYEDGAETSVAG